jgi:hypothetical protein
MFFFSFFTSNTKSLIDLAFSNKSDLIIKSRVEHVGISDHGMVFVHRKISVLRKSPKMVNTRQYKYYNIPLFKSDWKDIFSTSVFNNENPNDVWYDWKTKFLMVADSHAPPITYPESRAWFPLAWKIRFCRFCV